MRSLRGISVPAPSSALLKFLRSQTEYICFFTANNDPLVPNRRNGTKGSHQHRRITTYKSSFRRFSSTPRHQASVESSIINFSFLHRLPQKWCSSIPESVSKTQPRFLARHRSHSEASAHRSVSSDTRHLLSKLWHLKQRKPEATLKPDDLPLLPGFLDDGGGTTLGRSAGKASNELKLRCTELDENGNVTLTSGEFKKSELIAKVRM